jgi:uncharacterized phage-associated protein
LCIYEKLVSSTIKILNLDIHRKHMPETVEKDETVEKLDNLSDKKIEERADKALERFKDKLKKYSSE